MSLPEVLYLPYLVLNMGSKASHHLERLIVVTLHVHNVEQVRWLEKALRRWDFRLKLQTWVRRGPWLDQECELGQVDNMG